MGDRSGRFFASASLLAFALAGWSVTVLAADRYALAWHPVEGCPTAADLHGRIDRILGASPVPGDMLAADASVTTDGSTYRVHLVLASKGAPTIRDIDGDSCNAVADATALIVALAIDPNAIENAPAPVTPSAGGGASTTAGTASARTAPAASAAPTAPATSEAPVTSASASPPPPAREPRVRSSDTQGDASDAPPYAFVSAGYVLDTATLPKLGSGLGIDVGYRLRHLSFAAEGWWLGARDARLETKPSEGAGVGAFGLGARGCWELIEGSALDLGPCAGAEVAWLRASGFGAAIPADASARLFRLDFAARAQLRILRVALFVEAGAALPLTRPEFVIENAGTVEHVAPASFLGKIGGQVHF